jgi:hypothetical protein
MMVFLNIFLFFRVWFVSVFIICWRAHLSVKYWIKFQLGYLIYEVFV